MYSTYSIVWCICLNKLVCKRYSSTKYYLDIFKWKILRNAVVITTVSVPCLQFGIFTELTHFFFTLEVKLILQSWVSAFGSGSWTCSCADGAGGWVGGIFLMLAQTLQLCGFVHIIFLHLTKWQPYLSKARSDKGHICHTQDLLFIWLWVKISVTIYYRSNIIVFWWKISWIKGSAAHGYRIVLVWFDSNLITMAHWLILSTISATRLDWRSGDGMQTEKYSV